MSPAQNIYQYKNPKSKNEEVHYLSIHGRITRRALILRLLLAIMIQLILMVLQKFFFSPEPADKPTNIATHIEENNNHFFSDIGFINFYLPCVLIIFVLIQMIKRIHDVNKSGWNALIPIYNFFLLTEEGSARNNSFGINPRPQNQVNFFDELR
jgi:uncharacterized membrane protein YhaH (DUF805 family)